MWIDWASQSRLNSLMRIWLRLMRLYFRVDVEGMHHIPKKGGALLIANHSGFAGADALILTHIVKRETKRRARIMAHRAFFDFSPELKKLAESFGLKKASIQEGVDTLKSGRMMIVFPEGETGNFKSTFKSYRLQAFKTGFLRMALQADVPIIPCVVLGAEESHLNLGNINLGSFFKGIRIPLPLNLFPLPAKWRISVLPPLGPEWKEGLTLTDRKSLEAKAAHIRHQIQREIRFEIKRRQYIYGPSTAKAGQKVQKVVKTAKKAKTVSQRLLGTR